MTASCPTCQIKTEAINRKTHISSDWHVYNLKRVIASLPPLDEATFKLKQQQFMSMRQANEPSAVEKRMYCEHCKRSFSSKKSYDNHLASKQHKRNVELFQSKPVVVKTQPVETVDEGVDTFPLPVGACLFCDQTFEAPVFSRNQSDAADRVLRHMFDSHKFSLPYFNKLKRPVDLLIELGRLVGEEYACIACGRQFIVRTHGEIPTSSYERRKIALNAVRAHMLDARHTYLFCGSDDPVQIALAIAEAEDDGHTRPESLPPIARIGGEFYSQFYEPHLINKTLVLPESDGNDFEVHLPTGGVIGHRKFYNIVYRQHLPYIRSSSETRRRPALTYFNNVKSLDNSNGCGVLSTAPGSQQTRMSRIDSQHQKSIQSRLSKYDLNVGISGNYFLRDKLRRQY